MASVFNFNRSQLQSQFTGGKRPMPGQVPFTTKVPRQYVGPTENAFMAQRSAQLGGVSVPIEVRRGAAQPPGSTTQLSFTPEDRAAGMEYLDMELFGSQLRLRQAPVFLMTKLNNEMFANGQMLRVPHMVSLNERFDNVTGGGGRKQFLLNEAAVNAILAHMSSGLVERLDAKGVVEFLGLDIPGVCETSPTDAPLGRRDSAYSTTKDAIKVAISGPTHKCFLGLNEKSAAKGTAYSGIGGYGGTDRDQYVERIYGGQTAFEIFDGVTEMVYVLKRERVEDDTAYVIREDLVIHASNGRRSMYPWQLRKVPVSSPLNSLKLKSVIEDGRMPQISVPAPTAADPLARQVLNPNGENLYGARESVAFMKLGLVLHQPISNYGLSANGTLGYDNRRDHSFAGKVRNGRHMDSGRSAIVDIHTPAFDLVVYPNRHWEFA